jgi:histidinol-phosphate phosphatase family protein
MYPVVILAAGHGSRVRHLTGPDRSKMLLPVDGRPFIDAKLASLAAAGATDVLLLVGHGAVSLREHVGGGADFGLRVTYLDEGEELSGTGGAIARAMPQLPDAFWVTYGDTLLDVPLSRVEAQLGSHDVLGVMTTLENRDRWETSNVDVEGGLVTAYEKGAPPGTYRWIDYGMLLFRGSAFADFAAGSTFDLGDVLRPLVDRRRLGAFEVSERFHDVGTEEAWRETDTWAQDSRLWARLERSLSTPAAARPAVFLDRDGVLNEVRLEDGVPRPPSSMSDLRVVDGAAEALERLRDAGFALVVITNQPDVPRGETTREVVNKINAALEARLPIDAVYTCFHDTGDGCDCRKPGPGMLLQAADDLGLSLEDSWLVGDRWIDIAAAEAVSVTGVLVDRDYSWRASSDGPPPHELRPAFTVDNIAEAANAIVGASTEAAFESGSDQSV